MSHYNKKILNLIQQKTCYLFPKKSLRFKKKWFLQLWRYSYILMVFRSPRLVPKTSTFRHPLIKPVCCRCVVPYTKVLPELPPLILRPGLMKQRNSKKLFGSRKRKFRAPGPGWRDDGRQLTGSVGNCSRSANNGAITFGIKSANSNRSAQSDRYAKPSSPEALKMVSFCTKPRFAPRSATRSRQTIVCLSRRPCEPVSGWLGRKRAAVWTGPKTVTLRVA